MCFINIWKFRTVTFFFLRVRIICEIDLIELSENNTVSFSFMQDIVYKTVRNKSRVFEIRGWNGQVDVTDFAPPCNDNPLPNVDHFPDHFQILTQSLLFTSEASLLPLHCLFLISVVVSVFIYPDYEKFVERVPQITKTCSKQFHRFAHFGISERKQKWYICIKFSLNNWQPNLPEASKGFTIVSCSWILF